MDWFFRFSLLSTLLLTSACTSQLSRLTRQPVVSVNGDSLSTKEFADELAHRLYSLDAVSAKNPTVTKRAKEQIISNFIATAIARQWAKKNQIQVTDDELEQAVSAVRKSYPDDIAFRQILAKENVSFDAWRSKLRNSLLEKKVFVTLSRSIEEPSQQDIEAYYKANASDYTRKPQIKIRQIVVEKEDLAQSLLKRLQKEGKFEDLAKEFSIMPERNKGGEVGWVERGTLEVFDKVFNLNKNAYSQVLKSAYGYHVIQVLEKRPDTQLKLTEVHDTIKRMLQSDREQAAYTKWLEEQVKAAKVMRSETLIESISVETQKD